jgi:predicted nucleotidyltransferase
MNRLLSSADFARRHGISEQRVRQLVAAGKLPAAVRIGARWAIPADARVSRVAGGRPPTTRRGLLRQAARSCERALASAGVRSRVVGSLAYGDVRDDSDLDLLILSHAGMTWARVQALVDDAARPYRVPVDVIFAETLPPAVRQATLRDARRACEL